MAKVVAIANQKGGVGKTTTAVNLAASLAVAEQRILLIDGDPQGNASSGVGLPREAIDKTVYDVLIGAASLDEVIHRSIQFKHLDVAAATADLAAAEVELVDQPDRDRAMRNAIALLSDRYDYVLIDCPPSLGLITINMLVAADSILIPVQCEYYALEGLSQLLNTVNLVQRSANPALKIEGVLLTMYDARLNLSRQVAADAREFFGSQVYETVIPRNIRLAEAPSFGKPIVVYDVSSVGAQTYMGVARELILRNSPVPPAAAITGQATVGAEEDADPSGKDRVEETPVEATAQPLAVDSEAQRVTTPVEPLGSLANDAEIAGAIPPAERSSDSQADSGLITAPNDISERVDAARLQDAQGEPASDAALDPTELVVFESTTVESQPADGHPNESANQIERHEPEATPQDDPERKPNLESSLGSA